MARWEQELAFRHAPVLLQKVNRKCARADFITRVDFAHPWRDIHRNWDAVLDMKGDEPRYKLPAHAYYSVVATDTHLFLLYAFYHPRDWLGFLNPARSSPEDIDQHLHDMEGCLAVVPRDPLAPQSRVEAVLTVSHFHFYSYMGWEFGREPQAAGPSLPAAPFRVAGWQEEDRDGPICGTTRFAGPARPGRKEPAEPPYRFKLYAHACGHAIRGDRKDWGDEKLVVRYRPSLLSPEEPGSDVDAFVPEDDLRTQTVRYQLLPIHSDDPADANDATKDYLWCQRLNPAVFQTNDKGQEAFAKASGERDADGRPIMVAGSANPPWGWDDTNDANKAGDFAWHPAHLVYNYFAGLKSFGLQYVHNRYLGIAAPSL